jgi:hypothetical protein
MFLDILSFALGFALVATLAYMKVTQK